MATAAVVALLLVAGGCSFFKSASITEMVPGMSKELDRLECWITIEFKKVPGGMNPRDVKVRFSSIALDKPAEFDWEYIAAHDVLPVGDMQGYKDNSDSQPDRDPPLGVPIRVNYALQAKERIYIPAGEAIKIRAELFWGGKLVDSEEGIIEHVYERQPK
jgi:hypothetical protein